MLRVLRFMTVIFIVLAFISMAVAIEKKPVPAKPAPVKSITGSVVAIDKTKITVMTGAGPVAILADEKATVIRHMGISLPLKDLTPKSKITVEYEVDVTKPLQTARSIDVKTLAPKEEKK